MKTISKLFSQLLAFFFKKKSEPTCVTTINVSVEDKVAVVNSQPIELDKPVEPKAPTAKKTAAVKTEQPIAPKKPLPKKPTKVARAPAKKAVPMKQAAKKVPVKVAK